ncbi:vacuolar ATP synthase subunit I [Leptotrichia trevisanii]|uniref:Vacuolar ATP synthase subunit I n=1 Tax=Leptotrichia trevisanii TaxID=109328 RepID=A0A510KKH8_9FUSO|nr:V-type ATP synthase subunit I [Leptotrichia trevisanii]BBM52156.1 vacuolar ATP synthase subunit I [Leptotrichia trevisanii]BBM57110.1 vacuolar ATP synthase subunit I [Leptotrichia trevisanii]
MAIVKMSRFDLVVFAEQRAKVLKKLQKFKEVNFVDIELRDENGEVNKDVVEGVTKYVNNEELTHIDERLYQLSSAISLIKKYDERKTRLRDVIHGNENYTFDELAKKALTYDWKKISSELNQIGAQYSQIKSEISKKYARYDEIDLWERLDVNPKELKSLKKVNTFLGTVPIKLKGSFIDGISKLDKTYYEELKIVKDEVYYLVISSIDESEKEKLAEVFRNSSFTVENLDIDAVPQDYKNELQKEISGLKKEKRRLKAKIKTYSEDLTDLQAVYEYMQNKKLRIVESEKLAQTENTILIKGWIPTEKVNEFEKVVKDEAGDNYYLTFTEADRDDATVPIKLKNGKIASTFENLTGMYAYPRYNEIDPTPLFTPFYILFFGMMGADVGYGLVLLLATMFVLKVVNLSSQMRKSVKFFFYLSFSVIFWGLLYGSYFGATIPGMWRLIDPASQYNDLLIGSIVFGVVHIFVGLAIKAYMLIRDGKSLEAVYDVLFWYMALMGGIVYLIFKLMNLSPVVTNVSMWVMIAGMAGIVLTGGREAKGIGAKLGGGLYSLYGISSYVGDFVSYSRLMALGLSGGFIASAINMIAGMISGSWVGMIFIPVILVAGHLFNMFLSFLGAYVHTSRLMYVEYFGKFYEGGGKPFKDFRTESKYVNLDD